MEEYEFEAFQRMNWDSDYTLVDGRVAEIPEDPVVVDTYLDLYFQNVESESDLDEFVKDYFKKMENNTEDYLEILTDRNGRRLIAAVTDVEVRREYHSKAVLTKFMGEEPEEKFLKDLENMGIIDSERCGDRVTYTSVKDSDAYWILQLEVDLKKESDTPSMLDNLSHESEEELLRKLDSDATSFDEFISMW